MTRPEIHEEETPQGRLRACLRVMTPVPAPQGAGIFFDFERSGATDGRQISASRLLER